MTTRPWPAWPALLLACFGLLFAGGPVRAQEPLPVPALNARVIDQTGTLSAEQQAALVARLAAFEREVGSQIAVLLVPTTAPEDIAGYTQRVGDAWKIGRPEVGDGLLIVVAKDDRRVRIAPAKALEGAVPDLAARQIIDRYITPAFRAGDYAGGLTAAIDALGARIRGEALPPPPAGTGTGTGQPGAQFQDLALFFLLAVPVVGAVLTGLLGRKLGSAATGFGAGGLAWLLSASLVIGAVAGVVALLLVGVLGVGGGRRGHRGGGVVPPIIWGGGGGGWGGGFGGGGGFSSGGGGDFGGGGASGSW